MAYGGELNKVWPYESKPGYRGMVATDDIEEGELVAFIPRPAILTYREAGKTSVIARYFDDETMLLNNGTFRIRSDYLRMIFFVMQERRNPFSEYYDWI